MCLADLRRKGIYLSWDRHCQGSGQGVLEGTEGTMVMTGCDEEPGKGSELLGTGYLNDKSVPSWFPSPGWRRFLKTWHPISYFCLRPWSQQTPCSHMYAALQPSPSPAKNICVSSCNDGGAVVVCMYHTCSNNNSPLTKPRANNCELKKYILLLTGNSLGHLAEGKVKPLWRDIPLTLTQPAQAAPRMLVKLEQTIQIAKCMRKPATTRESAARTTKKKQEDKCP